MPDPVRLRGSWVVPLLAMLLLQSIGAFLVQILPVLAPLLSQAHGWPATAVGYFVASTMLGSILFLLFGLPLLRMVGAVRSVQIGFGLGLVGIAVLFVPVASGPVLASLLIGVAYGTAMPAGSQVLQRHAPARHRSLVFSIKQAGVPLGAALAGVTLPFAASRGGWQMALIVAGAIVSASILIVQPARKRVDREGEQEPPPTSARTPRLRALAEPITLLLEGRTFGRLALVGACLAANQGSWNAFLITYLVGGAGMSLSTAGLMFALMQVSAIVGRMLLGFVADRRGSGLRIIQVAAIMSGVASAALVFVADSLPAWATGLLLVSAGIAVTGWNGVHLAELAQRAPPHRVAEASAGGMVLVSVGLMGGPFITASLLALSGRYEIAFLVVAALPMLASLLLIGRDRPRVDPA